MTLRYFPWTEVTAITIRGRDRVKWLNNLTTNDMRRVDDKVSVECFVTDVKGRTLAHGIVSGCDDGLVFVSWGRGQGERLMAHWDRYIIREDVVLEDVSSRYAWYLRDLPAALAADVSAPCVWPKIGESSTCCQRSFPALGVTWTWLRFGGLEAGSEWVRENLSLGHLLSEREVEALRIAHRWPIVGIDFDEKNLPQELDRNTTGISFHKGCYLGQETVARLDALGQVQKKLVRLRVAVQNQHPSASGDPPCMIARGTVLRDGDQEAGWVTSSVWLAECQQWSLLAYIKRAHFEPGTVLKLNELTAMIEPDLPV